MHITVVYMVCGLINRMRHNIISVVFYSLFLRFFPCKTGHWRAHDQVAFIHFVTSRIVIKCHCFIHCTLLHAMVKSKCLTTYGTHRYWYINASRRYFPFGISWLLVDWICGGSDSLASEPFKWLYVHLILSSKIIYFRIGNCMLKLDFQFISGGNFFFAEKF